MVLIRTKEDALEALNRARELSVSVYVWESTDDEPDNGNLRTLNEIVLGINNAIIYINNLPDEEEG